MHRLATVHARDNQPTTNDVTTQPISISASFTKVKSKVRRLKISFVASDRDSVLVYSHKRTAPACLKIETAQNSDPASYAYENMQRRVSYTIISVKNPQRCLLRMFCCTN